MSINQTALKTAIRKESGLAKKLGDVRKKRDDVAQKIDKINKKRNITGSDMRRLGQYQSNLLDYEKEITRLTGSIRKNSEEIYKRKERVEKERKREYELVLKSIESQSTSNVEYLNNVSEMAEKLSQLAEDVKHTIQEKEMIEFDVFLSHSSLDKAVFVSELSEKLSNKGLKVFEDVKVFKIGQSQTDTMNMGILNSRFVVVFLSPNFIQSGWSEYEFKSFLNREINEKRIIILPIWHNVSVDEVRQYNPFLVDKFALDTKKFTVDEMVEHICQVVAESREKI